MIFRKNAMYGRRRPGDRTGMAAVTVACGLCTVLSATLPAAAQDASGDQVPTDAAARGPLAGPKVGDERPAPGVAMGFTEAGSRQATDLRANLRIYRRALAAVELTNEQKTNLREIVGRYEAETHHYLDQHAEELKQVREIIRKHRVNPRSKRDPVQSTDDAKEMKVDPQGAQRVRRRDVQQRTTDRPITDQQMTDRPITDQRITDRPLTDRKPDAELERAQQRLREINRGRPSVDPYLLEIWDALTVEQQSQFEAELRTISETIRQRRLAAGRRDGAGDREMMSMDQVREELGEVENDRRAMIRRLLEKDESELTPRERRILERIRQRQTDVPIGDDRIRRHNVDPPSMDEIEIGNPKQEEGQPDRDGRGG